MKKVLFVFVIGVTVFNCSKQIKNKTIVKKPEQMHSIDKKINEELPTIGILIFEGVIINEVVAPLDVFSNKDYRDKALFNVITIAKENKTYTSAHGLKITPDYNINNVPNLKVLVVPSSYTPSDQTTDKKLVEFVKKQNKTTDYIASHCAGAYLIGETGIADNKEIVTYVTGGESLKSEYPNLLVADDSKVSVIIDGKFISSNGSLVSYIASFDLLEKLTDKEHRKYVETSILFNRLKEN
ncbi:DJ-1/PfpI family protein [uncultured Algibacter sp.]|uniref:DJ-1/PfpI family protein n=1 Tax=uncultured Algibacter sp. TaxID=298659 RepID=UPI00260DE5DD|nr:DJ-1/PfpI family protein [uncultured Algibacter sp.]